MPSKHGADMPNDRQTFFAIKIVKSSAMKRLQKWLGQAHILKINKSQQHKMKFWECRKSNRGRWVRSKNVTSVLYSPSPFLTIYEFQVWFGSDTSRRIRNNSIPAKNRERRFFPVFFSVMNFIRVEPSSDILLGVPMGCKPSSPCSWAGVGTGSKARARRLRLKGSGSNLGEPYRRAFWGPKFPLACKLFFESR